MSDVFDLGRLGYRELRIAGELLLAYGEERPDAWDDTGVKLCFNPVSGMVFLTNQDFQVLALNGDKAEIFYALPYSGSEGFISELWDDFQSESIVHEDYEYLADYLKAEGMYKEARQVEEAMNDGK